MTRSDALRNRHQAIEGARTVLAERGLDAPLDEIARRAGIGNATLYRHFPERSDLVIAACADALSEVEAAGERARAEPDPWTALREYLAFICELCVRDRAMADLFTVDAPLAPELDALRETPIANLQRLIKRAKRQGSVRRDCTVADIELILNSTAGLAERSHEHPRICRRHLELLLDGLQPRAPARET